MEGSPERGSVRPNRVGAGWILPHNPNCLMPAITRQVDVETCPVAAANTKAASGPDNCLANDLRHPSGASTIGEVRTLTKVGYNLANSAPKEDRVRLPPAAVSFMRNCLWRRSPACGNVSIQIRLGRLCR